VILRHKEGDELHVATQWILYRDAAGNPIGVAEVLTDVTKLRRAEAAVREADRRKDEFLALLAHELRNPLAPIRTGLELMKILKDDPQQLDETHAIMERQMQQLVRLIDDLLDVSRISRGKLELRRARVALSDVVRSAVEANRPALDAAGHQLSVLLPADALSVHADPHRLAQVVSNLLDNAVKYTPRGGRISLEVRRDGADAVLSVKDNGIGIPEDMLDRVFEMFTRSKRDVEFASPGLGIGLALVRSIVQMHGGRVEVESGGERQGTELRIYLPLLVDATTTVQQPAISPAATNNHQRRVLIVDDNEDAARVLSLAVKQLGNDVRLARDGEEAIEVAGQFQPEVVLMDLGMPKLDGYDAARHIRQQPWGRDMLLVALSGWGQDGHKQRAKEAGFDHHLIKPADLAEVKRLIARAAGQ
jgi:signal transduction histidine kinase/CheY-like chemotaxis protein